MALKVYAITSRGYAETPAEVATLDEALGLAHTLRCFDNSRAVVIADEDDTQVLAWERELRGRWLPTTQPPRLGYP